MTVWSGFVYAGGNGMQVGIDYASPTALDTNSATYQYDFYFSTQNQYTYSGDAQALDYGGDLGGSDAYVNSGGPGSITQRTVRSVNYVYADWGVPHSVTVSVQVSGAYNGSNPYLAITIPVPPRPFAHPNALLFLAANRVADNNVTLTWANADYAQGPYTSITIEASYWDTSGGWTDMGIVAALPGSPPTPSASFNWLSSNRIYAFRARANNQTGSSVTNFFPWVYQSPAAPTNLQSALGPTGTTIVNTWTVNNYSAIGVTTYSIERSVNGGAWGSVATGIADATSSWIDPTPGAGANQYRIQAVSSASGGSQSGWATGNSVSTVVAPLAPTGLTPDGIAVDLEFVGGVLIWTHNPAGDFAAQSHYTIEKSSDGGGTWTALAGATNVASAVSSHTVAAGTLTNGTTWLWKVKTQGGTTAGFGPFSAAATITAQATPTVTFTAGHPADPTIALPVEAQWVYAQDEAVAQAGWEARLYAADGVTLLEDQTGTGTGTAVSFAYPTADGETYVVAVRAMSGTGLWSAWATVDTTIDLPPPAPTTLVATYQPCTGTMSLSISSASPGVGEAVVEWVVVERRVAGGDWVVLARDVPPDTTMLDLIPLTNGLNEYRVTGVSSTPSTLVNGVVQVQGTDGQNLGPGRDGLWVFVNYGPGFSSVLRVHNDLDIQDSPGRAQRLQGFLGRRKPTLLSGVGVTREVSVSGALFYLDPCPNPDTCRYDSPPRDWITAGEDADVVCYRDFTGRRLFASLDGVQVTDGYWPGKAALGFKVAEADYTEVTGVLVP